MSVLVVDAARLTEGLAGNTDRGALERWVRAEVVRTARDVVRGVARLVDLMAEARRIEHEQALGRAPRPATAEPVRSLRRTGRAA